MSLYHRIKRWLGYDTVRIYDDEYPLYEYTVTHLNGEETVAEANGHKYKEGFLLLWEYTENALLVDGTIGALWSMDTTRRLEGIQEIERERVGFTYVQAAIDVADYTTIDSKINNHSYD